MLVHDPRLLSDLTDAANIAIVNALANGGARTPKPTHEVPAVRTLTLDGFDAIAAAWAALVRRRAYRLELTAVFCHSRPQVNFTPHRHLPSTGRCELADLLIVIDHQDWSGHIDDRRAVLVQAKRLKGQPDIKLQGSEWTQHELLSDLPSFVFDDRIYDPRQRDLKASPPVGDPQFTAEYGGVELQSAAKRWAHWIPMPPDQLRSPIELGFYLAQMAMGLDGCGRLAIANGQDDWSFTVDELLRVTGALPIVQSTPAELRGNSNVIGRICDTAAYLSVPPGLSAGGGPTKSEDDYWPDGPISVVHLTARQDEALG